MAYVHTELPPYPLTTLGTPWLKFQLNFILIKY